MNNQSSSQGAPSVPSPGSSLLALGFALILTFGAAAIGGVATGTSVNSWYLELAKPTWNPPGWVFGPVWTLLYTMMAISAWLVWRAAGWKRARLALGLYLVQLALNSLWSILFFGLQRPDWAMAEILALWCAIAATTAAFYRHSRLAAGLMIPYLAWVSFAAVLNYSIFRLN